MLSLKEALSGLIIIGFSIVFGLPSLLYYDLGTVARMGPGFFPLALSMIMFVLGISMVALSCRSAPDPEAKGRADLILDAKAIAIVSVSLLSFILLLEPMGLVVSIFAMAFIVIRVITGSSRQSALASFAISAGCIAIFHYGLGANIPLFGSWIN